MSQATQLIADVCVTRMIISAAAARADQPALIGAASRQEAETYSYRRFAATVEAAASGLARRGLQARDVVGILVPDAVSFILARHAVHAAGGVPTPVDPGLPPAEIAGQLAESGARMLITAPPLAEAALAAADRSWVRQVFSFADAPGTTRFSDLLGLDTVRPVGARPDDLALMPFSRGPDGRLRPVPLSHAESCAHLHQLEQQASLVGGDVLLATPPGGDGLGYTLLTDSAMLRGATVVAACTAGLATAAARYHGTAAIVPPADVGIVPDGLRAIGIG
ncbi:MAG: AMP-binding protein [Streptosporangiaceae bacterium]